MASLLRVLSRTQVLNTKSVFKRQVILPAVFLSTSKKNKDAATISESVQTMPKESEERLDQKEENWISYGYSLTDREEDEWANHLIMFSGITIAMCGIGFIWAYMPDHRMRDWSQREAFLELARREAAGEPLIDKNVVPEDRFTLPSDEELGDMEIVI